MSNANPVKEPSMDEILASIRRIIENGDDRGVAAGGGRSASPRRAEQDPETGSGRESGRVQQVVADAQTLAQLLSRTTQSPRTQPEPRVDHGWQPDAFGEIRGSLDHGTQEAFADLRIADAVRPRPHVPVIQPVRDALVFDDLGDVPRAAPDVARATRAIAAGHVVRDMAARQAEGRSTPSSRPAALPDPFTLAGHKTESSRSDLTDEADEEFSLDFDEERYALELQALAGQGVEEEPEFGVAPRDENGGEAALSGHDRAESESQERFLAYLAASADVPDVVTADPAAQAAIKEASALISEQAGEQVAAAFDDLAKAIRDGQMRSMEDMARDMLRPMLQEWLDDNLPRLVEKMVREEIERVSRGGRR